MPIFLQVAPSLCKIANVVSLPQAVAGLVFALVVAFFVWLSTRAVDRLSTILIGGMIVAFVFAIGGLFTEVKMPVLFNTTESHASYLPYALAALPYLLTSFGYHGNIPGLVTYYRKDGKAVMKSLLIGTLISLAIYILWQFVVQVIFLVKALNKSLLKAEILVTYWHKCVSIQQILPFHSY